MNNTTVQFFSSLLLLALLGACQPQSEPDTGAEPQSTTATTMTEQVTLLYDARIATVDADRPYAEAMAFDEDGLILALGGSEELASQYPRAKIIDLDHEGLVVPGLIDAHGHLMSLGFAQQRADLTGTRNTGEIIARLREHAATLPAGAWLLGRGWDQNDWVEDAADAAFPDRQVLDAAFPERPVWLTRIDGHAGWANSAALDSLDEPLPDRDPPGGQIIRDADGRPTGVFIDAAMELVTGQLPEPGPEVREQALELALQQTRSHGLTGVHNAGTSLEDLRLFQRFITEDRFPLRIYAMADGDREAMQYLCENGLIVDPDGLLQARSVKMYLDGALGSRGAALVEDYSDQPGHRGLLFAGPETFNGQVAKAMRCGLQVNTHAIGDRANDVLLEAYAAAMQQVPEHSGRHRIEHAQVMRAGHYQRTAELGIIASVQPTHATSDMYWAEQRLGPERIRHAYAWQRFLEAGAPLALGSDFPVESVDPLLGFHAAVTRQDEDRWPPGGWYPDQRLTRAQALHGFTLGAAYAAFMEHQVGSLEPGKQADFVWLSQDIMQIDPAGIPDTEVLATWLGGKRVYARP